MNESGADIDGKILLAIKQGDRDAYRKLFLKYYKELCLYGSSFIENDIEDVVQDIFMTLWSNRKTIEIHTNIKQYLFSSVKKKALNIIKHNTVRQNHSEMLSEFLNNLANTNYSDEEMKLIERLKVVLEELPEQCCHVLKLSTLEGKKYKEIAELLDISVHTVKGHITRAYRIIRERFGEDRTLLLFLIAKMKK